MCCRIVKENSLIEAIICNNDCSGSLSHYIEIG